MTLTNAILLTMFQRSCLCLLQGHIYGTMVAGIVYTYSRKVASDFMW